MSPAAKNSAGGVLVRHPVEERSPWRRPCRCWPRCATSSRTSRSTSRCSPSSSGGVTKKPKLLGISAGLPRTGREEQGLAGAKSAPASACATALMSSRQVAGVRSTPPSCGSRPGCPRPVAHPRRCRRSRRSPRSSASGRSRCRQVPDGPPVLVAEHDRLLPGVLRGLQSWPPARPWSAGRPCRGRSSSPCCRTSRSRRRRTAYPRSGPYRSRCRPRRTCSCRSPTSG